MLQIALYFAVLSLVSVGGIPSVMPEMQRLVVDVQGWMSAAEFTQAFAIAQAAPGPNVLIVTLIGNHVAGITGALVATFFMCGPACTVSFFVARVFDRFKDKPWRKAIQTGLVPVSVGLVASTALIIARSADHDIATLVVTGVTFALTYWTRISPLYALGAATAIGMAGWL